MRMPNPEWAFVDIRKLRDYCLNPEHPYGAHKARAFAAALGLTAADAEALRERLVREALSPDAVQGRRDQHGQTYVIDFRMVGITGTASVRSAWIVRYGEDFPRLTTCYVLKRGRGRHERRDPTP